MTKQITESRVKELIQAETSCLIKSLDKLSADLTSLKESQKRIERVLLGDKDYDDKGIAYMVNYSYNYARKNTESNLVERAETALETFYRYEKNGHWKIFEEMVDKYKAIKWFAVIITGGGLLSAVNIILQILKLFGE